MIIVVFCAMLAICCQSISRCDQNARTIKQYHFLIVSHPQILKSSKGKQRKVFYLFVFMIIGQGLESEIYFFTFMYNM